MDYNIKGIKEAIELIEDLDNHEGCMGGGYCHIVTDDYNLLDSHIDSCLEDCKKNEWDIPEESRIFCIKVLNSLKKLQLIERHIALVIPETIDFIFNELFYIENEDIWYRIDEYGEVEEIDF